MTRSAELVFPLIPARKGGALDTAGSPSRRRGSGTEIASSRPYRRGDAIRLVDWAASARLSTARGTDEFIVRDHFAEDAVRIVVVADLSPSMALFPDWLPWLDKRAAVHVACRMIVASGAATNALIGFAGAGAHGARSVPPRRDRGHWRAIEQRLATGVPDGPPDSLDRALELLSRIGPVCAAGNVRLRPLRLPAAAEPDSADRRSYGGLGRHSRRRPGSGLGAVVPGSSGCHASSRRPRRWHTLARAAQPRQRHARAGSSTSSARSPRPGSARLRARSGDDHEQRPAGGPRRVPRVGRTSPHPDSEAIDERGRHRGREQRHSGGTPAARVLAIVLILGAATAAILGAVVLDRPSSTTHPLDEPLTVKRALSTSAALFGDPIGAEIDVYTNDRSIAARSVRVSTDFKPYRVAATTVERVGHGGVSLLRTRISLECLARACLPPRGGKAAVHFPPFAVTYRHRGRDARVVVPWEPLQLSSRLPAEATTSVGIIDTAPPLDPRFERSPETLRVLFLLVAACSVWRAHCS